MHARSGKRPLDTEINVVPFIDLMAVTIAFLLITAVWTQAGALPASRSGGAGEATEDPARELRLTAKGVSLGAGPLVSLDELEKQLAGTHTVVITTDDDVAYDDLIRVIDTCRAARVEGVSVSPAT